jgi:3-deoxy-D-manno-octulosonic-acid transferase
MEQKPVNAEELRKAAEPLIKYLCENHHPHVTVIVTPTSVELLEGKCSVPNITDFLVD